MLLFTFKPISSQAVNSPWIQRFLCFLEWLFQSPTQDSRDTFTKPPPPASVVEEKPDSLCHSFGAVEAPAFTLIHEAFASHVRLSPDQTAVLDALGAEITYKELDRQSDFLGHRLRMAGVSRETRVCLLVRRSIQMVVGIMSILKSGASYIPLDGGIVPDSTLSAILSDSKPTLVLCSGEYAARLKGTNIPVLCLEDVIELDHSLDTADQPQILCGSEVCPSDEAYVIYTSGTTGCPKGVSISHQNVTNLICLYPGNLGIRPGMRVAQLLNVAFDMCAWEILGCLVNGGTLCLRGSSPCGWKNTLKSANVVIATPSVLAQHDPVDYPNIKVVATAGEPCPETLADRWARTATFYNCCGPTEVTIVNTVHRHHPQAPLSIGRPTPNNSVYILDEDLIPVLPGAMGVMWAGGAGISRGYLNLPSLTRQRFVPDPFFENGRFMYNTGDLGRWRADGTIEHLGRIDDQVKIKGFRVELDGVASAMQSCPGVTGSVATLVGKELWGFYVPKSMDCDVIRAFVAQTQPYYAVPTRYMALDEFPLTSNGKVDKKRLRMLTEAGI